MGTSGRNLCCGNGAAAAGGPGIHTLPRTSQDVLGVVMGTAGRSNAVGGRMNMSMPLVSNCRRHRRQRRRRKQHCHPGPCPGSKHTRPAAPYPPSPDAHGLDGALLAAVLLHRQHHAAKGAARKRPQKAVFGGGGCALQSLAQACEVLVGRDGHHGAAVIAMLSYGGPLGVPAVVESG